MPNSPDNYQSLREHLKSIDPAIEAFCLDHDFVKDMGSLLDRYPARRLTRKTDINASIDIFMNMKKPDKYFEEFFPEVPYTMLCGMWCDEQGSRYFLEGGFSICESLPYNLLEANISDFLQQAADFFNNKDKSYLINNGQKTVIIPLDQP